MPPSFPRSLHCLRSHEESTGKSDRKARQDLDKPWHEFEFPEQFPNSLRIPHVNHAQVIAVEKSQTIRLVESGSVARGKSALRAFRFRQCYLMTIFVFLMLVYHTQLRSRFIPCLTRNITGYYSAAGVACSGSHDYLISPLNLPPAEHPLTLIVVVFFGIPEARSEYYSSDIK
jgi:hypothetical protein